MNLDTTKTNMHREALPLERKHDKDMLVLKHGLRPGGTNPGWPGTNTKTQGLQI